MHDASSVSAVIPVYNGRRFLRSAVMSVIDQTAKPDELILVDDGSSDGGLETVEDLTAPFPIRILRQENRGQSAARNHGAKVANGDLFAFLDQDDRWLPDHLATLCAPFERDAGIGWCHGDFEEIDAIGRTVTRSFLAEHGVAHPKTTLAACLASDLMVLPTASVLRRTMFEELGGFDETLSGYEDDDLYVRAFRSGWRIDFSDRATCQFRVHSTSSSANRSFAVSRRRFSDKLQADVADDHRLNRYYFADLVAPRFFQSSLHDYVQATTEGNQDAAREAFIALEHFASLRRDRRAVAWKVALIRDPRRFRMMLRLHEALPRRLRVTANPVLRPW